MRVLSSKNLIKCMYKKVHAIQVQNLREKLLFGVVGLKGMRLRRGGTHVPPSAF